ncbi:Ankyrin repeat and LEM domain-containing protein 1 [Araneus ventricosus]|uniref:Ankyrin repeat and LEM domain-containing protein 1 n=1 Tax=Araneus ventricosus TaxID=182803 RepID=A0A4Y2NU88_ARAVE|nr:Ankyrin repeat and LEM domain-containing protein 1 [Araneus ventricosus]GBN45194.1 Ankyrin repeat and LEM domain-containing protein 1 [Araneus ventricosus]
MTGPDNGSFLAIKKMTDILEAVFNCDLNRLKILLSDTSKVNDEIPGTEGCTPLHLIVGIENVTGKEDVLSFLLDIGANPNARSHDDLTPVHIAAMWNNCFELEKLLQKGGNPWLTDNENKNSFDLAINNYAYEAYQLLHRYLAEDKLNFRNSTCKSTPKPVDSKEYVSRQTNVQDDNDIVSPSFFSANENCPVLFSSTDDETGDFFQNVSRILKKSIMKNQNPEQEISPINFTANINDNKIPANEKELDLLNDSDSTFYSLHSNKTIQDRTHNNAAILSSDDTDIGSISESDIFTAKTRSLETVVDSDNESGIALVEKYFSPSKYSSSKICESFHCECSANDWKSCRNSRNSSCSFWSNCSSHSNTLIVIPDEYKILSNSKIYQELKSMGDDPGPISDSTRDVYLRRLTRLKMGCNTSCTLPAPKYCQEVYTFLDGKLNTDRIQNLINSMSEEFNSLESSVKWREGNQRCCFNYFLLDPRVTQNLPLRLKHLTFEKTLLTFLDALFYVGKGTKGRPYSHLLEAARAVNNGELKNDKISHILDIWESGLGVISLHCFNNCIPVEAYTQEACIIEAVGLKNLTNIKNGDYYGIASKWKRSWKRQVGVALLHRALQIFILEGEKQILPKDIKTRITAKCF